MLKLAVEPSYKRFEVVHQLLLSLPSRYVKTGGLSCTLQVAEIGVRKGETAFYLLNSIYDINMYLVDPYVPYNDVLNLKFTQEDQNAFKAETLTKLAPFEHKFMLIEEPSVTAAKQFNLNFFDLVFIDAEHTYKAVKEDIATWYPLVNYGGILCGHDYSMTDITKAVNEFGGTIGQSVWHSGPHSDVWAFQK